jgi:hypothetical protein
MRSAMARFAHRRAKNRTVKMAPRATLVPRTDRQTDVMLS